MKLTEDAIRQFRQHGYVTMPEFFGAREVAALQSEIERLLREGFLRNVATDGDGKTTSQTRRNLQLCPMYRRSDLFRALPFDTKVVEAVRQLIGDPILLHLDQVFLKPPRDGMGTHWHQDNAYFKISDPLKGTAMWIAVHDATIANGTLHVIPGSFREAYEHSRDPYSDHHIRCYPPEERAVPVELPAGGVVFFCYGTAHCTRENKSDKARAGVAYHFLRADYAQEGLLAPDRDYRPYLTGPLASGGLKEYGVQVAGTWEQEVERVLSRQPQRAEAAACPAGGSVSRDDAEGAVYLQDRELGLGGVGEAVLAQRRHHLVLRDVLAAEVLAEKATVMDEDRRRSDHVRLEGGALDERRSEQATDEDEGAGGDEAH